MYDYRTIRETPVAEATTAVLTAKLLDALGHPVAASQVLTMTLTLIDRETGAIVNGRDHVDILNAGPGEIDIYGNLTVTFSPADTTLVNPELIREGRMARIDWTWISGDGYHEFWFDVEEITDRP
jgi:hypothetical protein